MVFNSNRYANLEGPEPKPLDLPVRRGSHGIPAVPANGGLMENVDSSASRSDRAKARPSSSAESPEARAREESEASEEELLESAMVIGLVSLWDNQMRAVHLIWPRGLEGSAWNDDRTNDGSGVDVYCGRVCALGTWSVRRVECSASLFPHVTRGVELTVRGCIHGVS